MLRKELVIDQIEVDGLEANVVRRRDGSFNFDDLLAKDDKQDNQDIVKFDAQGFKLKYATLNYSDEASGQTAKISGLGLETGRLADTVPSKFTLAANLEGDKPADQGAVADRRRTDVRPEGQDLCDQGAGRQDQRHRLGLSPTPALP